MEQIEYNLDEELLDFYIRCNEIYHQDSQYVYDPVTLLPMYIKL